MPNPLVKLWKYLTASANAQIDQRADPKIQIAQAIEAEQQRHQALANQAAAVLGNQRQLEMRLNRQLGEVEKLQASARQALVLADKTRAGGDAAQGGRVRERRAGLRHPAGRRRAVDGGPQAQPRRGPAGRRAGPRRGRAEPDAAADHAGRAHQADEPARAGQDAGARGRLACARSTSCRRRATRRACRRSATRSRRRYANALGQAELAQSSVEGRMLEVQKATLDVAGASRLDQIRASMSAGPAAVEGSQAAAAIEQGAPPVAAAGRRAARGPAGRASRDHGLRHRETRGHRAAMSSVPEYPPPSYAGSAGEADRVGARRRHAARAADGRGQRGPLPGHRARRPAGPSGSTAGRWARGRRARRRTSTAASPSRSTC